MTSFIPYGRQHISEDDLDAVRTVLQSGFLTSGPKVEEFEASILELTGARYAIAANSATSALHLAMMAAGIGGGHRVITSPNTFVASANCAAYVGATPDFADVDGVSYNLDPVALDRAWRPDVKAVVAVDYAGQSCDIRAIAELSRERGAIVIEDASHAVGGRFVDEGNIWSIGNHPWADMTVFSFHPVKTMTTGEGGVLVTNDETFAAKARQLRSHGIVREASQFLGLDLEESPHNPRFEERGPWYYEMQDLGYNYRITDIQCALGISQLNRLSQFMTRRRTIVQQYNEAFADLPWVHTPKLRQVLNRDLTSWHLYTVQMDFKMLGRTRTEVMTELKGLQIGTQVLYIPVHLQPWYRRTFGYAPGKCPIAEAYYLQALSLPLYPSMANDDVQRVISAIRSMSQTP